MNPADTTPRPNGRKGPVPVVLLIVTTALVMGAWAAWSLFGSRDDAGDDEVGVLSGVHVQPPGAVTSARSGQGTSTPGQGQAGNPGNGQPAPPGTAPANPHTFGISGNVEDIYPTYAGTLTVTFTNPHRFAIVVTELDVQIGDGACGVPVPDGVFAIGDELPVEGVPVSARTGNSLGTGSVGVDFEVSNDLPDECQDATFPLTYSGTAIRANQR